MKKICSYKSENIWTLILRVWEIKRYENSYCLELCGHARPQNYCPRRLSGNLRYLSTEMVLIIIESYCKQPCNDAQLAQLPQWPLSKNNLLDLP